MDTSIDCRHLGCKVPQEGNMRDHRKLRAFELADEVTSCLSKIVEAEKVLGDLLRSMRG